MSGDCGVCVSEVVVLQTGGTGVYSARIFFQLDFLIFKMPDLVCLNFFNCLLFWSRGGDVAKYLPT